MRLSAVLHALSTLQVLVLGSAFIIALYHLSIFLLRREDRSSLYLAVGCVILIVRLLAEGFYLEFGDSNYTIYTLVRRVDYMTFIWSPVVFGWLNHTLLPLCIDKRVLRAFVLIGAASTLFVMVTPVEVFVSSAFFDPVIAIEMGYSLWAVARAALDRREDSVLLLAASFILASSIARDIFYNAGVIGEIGDIGQLYAHGFLAYLYLYSFVLAKRFSKSFRAAKELSDELTDTLAQLNASVKARIDSELHFLRAQIQPHFLYNTLSMISSLITREPERAKELLLDLSDYLRESYRFDSQDGLIDLGEELRLVELYVKLVRARYKDRFDVIFDIDESVKLSVPMLSIQPLVENAVGHGVFDMTKDGVIEIAVKKLQDCVAISVKDNGKGMPQSKVDSILSGGEAATCGNAATVGNAAAGGDAAAGGNAAVGPGLGAGVGMANVNRRLIQAYGQGLVVESAPGRGTLVEIRIPFKEVAD